MITLKKKKKKHSENLFFIFDRKKMFEKFKKLKIFQSVYQNRCIYYFNLYRKDYYYYAFKVNIITIIAVSVLMINTNSELNGKVNCDKVFVK